MNEITIVTAFFDINRKEYKNFPRTNEQYLEYFSVWARMKNKVIVYTNSEMASKVKRIRKKYGLEDKTIVIEVNNEEEIEKDLYEKIKKVSIDNDFLNFRRIKDAISNKAKYDYVMLLKYWCLYDAVKKGYADGMVAWLDFGFNHGDKCYICPEEFSFLWKTSLDTEKIHVFSLNTIEKNKTIFKIIMNLNDVFMGAPIIVPAFLTEKFWTLMRDSMVSLLRVGFIDDDQLLLLMAYQEEKKLFEIHVSDWFLPLKENGGEHLTVRPKIEKKKENIIIKIIKKIKWIIRKERINYEYWKRFRNLIQ